MADFSLDFLDISSNVPNLDLPSPDLINFYKNLKSRILWISEDIDMPLVEYSKYIIQWNKEDEGVPVEERKPIKIMIFSYGGLLDVCFHFIDMIKISKTPIYGYNVGVAMSAAFMIFVACHKRYTSKHSTVLIHKGSTGISGVAGDVIQNVDYYKGQIKEMQDFIVENTNITPAVFKRNSKEDWYVNAQKQIEFGIANEYVEDIDMLS